MRQRAARLEQAGRDAFSRRALLEMQSRRDQLELKSASIKRQLVSLGLAEAEVESIVARKQIQSYLPVRSPVDGYLVRMTGTLGETVVANQVLAEVQKLQNVWIEAQVPSHDMSLLSLKNDALVTALSNPQVRFNATVSRVSPIVSASTRMQKIWLTPGPLPEQLVLRDGLQLSVAMSKSERVTSLVVPSEAILRDGLHAFVFVQKADGYLDRRRVSMGRTDGQWTEVRDGIGPGDEVVVAGDANFKLRMHR